MSNPSSSGDIDAIIAIYAATRADNSGIMNVAMALLGVGATYAVATLAFARSFGDAIPWDIVPLLPILMWMIAAFHAHLTIAAMLNAVTIQSLEKELKARSGLDANVCAVIGYSAPEKILNITISRWFQKLTAGITYLGVALLIVGYTIYILLEAGPELGIHIYWYVALYAAMAIIIAGSWIDGLQQSGTNAREAGF